MQKSTKYECPECGSRWVESIQGGNSDIFTCMGSCAGRKVRIPEQTPLEEEKEVSPAR